MRTKVLLGILIVTVCDHCAQAADGADVKPVQTEARQGLDAGGPSVSPTTAPPTTAPTTHPPSYDPLQKFHGTDGNSTCVLLWGKFLFSVPYQKTDGSTGTVDIGVHNHIKTSCDCDVEAKVNQTNTLTVGFFEKDWEMVVEFATDERVKSVALGGDVNTTFWWQQVNLTYIYSDKYMPGLNKSLNGAANTLSKTLGHHVFNASSVGSYRCNTTSEVEFQQGGKLTVTELQYLAFADNATQFPSGNVTECSPIKPPKGNTESFVPVAVGAALAGLVLIVLIAYMIGRARAKKKGYESV